MEQIVSQLKDEYTRLNLLLKEQGMDVGFYKAVKSEKLKIKTELLRLFLVAHKLQAAEKRQRYSL